MKTAWFDVGRLMIGAVGCAGMLLFLAPGVSGTASAQALDPTLRKIIDSKTLVIGHREDLEPFSYVISGEHLDEHGKPGDVVGYSIDLCLAVAENLKQSLSLPDLKVEYRLVSASTRFQALIDGETDILCGATTNTLNRREQVSFSLLTFATGIEMLVRSDSDFSAPTQLNGQRLGAVRDTTAHAAIVSGVARLGLVGTELVLFDDHDAGLAAVENGDIAAYFADRILLVRLIERASAPQNLTLVNRMLSYEPYALAVRRDSPEFLLQVDRTLAELYRSRDIVITFKKWFGTMGAMSNESMMRALYNLQAIPAGI